MEAIIYNFGEIIFNDKCFWKRIFGFPFLLDAATCGSGENYVGDGILMQIINQNVVADATVETANDKGINFAQCLDGGDGCLGNGGDAVVVKLNAVERAHQLDAVFQTLETGEMLEDVFIADIELFDSQNGGHDIVVVVPSRQIVVAV